jgi:FAD/FMN-containing dehydrogenase
MYRNRPIQVSPTDPRYPALVRAYNLRFAGRPRYVALCTSAAEVASAVQDALDAGLRLTVKSGGHCYEDFAVGNDGGVIVDMSLMTRVARDDASGLYTVEAGANLWDVYRYLYTRYGVTLPGGSCYSVGAAGHVLGGGYGALSRRHGLVSDYLAEVELVHVTAGGRAEVVVARRDDADPARRELLWAHQGGGGGNFGIVTRLAFADPPEAPGATTLFDLAWDWEHVDERAFGRIVRAYGEFFARHSDPESPYRDLDTGLGLQHRSAGSLSLSGGWFGEDPALLDAFLQHMRAAAAPSRETRRVMPWLQATQTTNESGPNRRGKYKSAYMIRPFPDREIDVMWSHLTDPGYDNPTAVVSVSSYGGRVNAVDPAATAVPQRSSILKLQYLTFWHDPAEDARHLGWIRRFYDAMYGPRGPWPDGVHDGCFVNYPDVDLKDYPYLYYKDNYPRLQAVKGRWDPLDVFHHAQSIRLP